MLIENEAKIFFLICGFYQHHNNVLYILYFKPVQYK